MEFKKVVLEELKDYVKAAFAGDEDLLTKYHISPGSLSHCVSHTMKTIEESRKKLKLVFTAVSVNSGPIGFFVTGKTDDANVLYSFGLNKNYRKFHPYINTWWNCIQKTLDYDFICVLHSKNTRAVNFLVNNGMEWVTGENDTIVLYSSNSLKNKILRLCPLQQVQL